MVKDWAQLTISNDFIFTRVMVKNPGICKRLLELILEFEIDEIVYPEREKTLTEHGLRKGIRLDVYVQSKDGRKHFDVEIQTSKKHELERQARRDRRQFESLSSICRRVESRELVCE